MGHRGLQLTIYLDAGTGAVSGQISAEGGDVRGFTGYAELIAAIEGLRAATPHSADNAQTAR